MADGLTKAIQQNLITMLAYDDVHGKIVSQMIDTNLFEGEMRVIGERCVDYWKLHGKAPGKAHTSDLVSDIYENPTNRKSITYQRILVDMRELSENINTNYVLEQLRTFTRMQRMKDAILKSAEQLNSKQELAIEEVEAIWNTLLRTSEVTYDAGMRLHDIDRMLGFLNQQKSEFSSGIRELDRRSIQPYRTGLTIFLAATGTGKSWYLVHTGKMALLQRKKVLHVSLEMSEEEVAQRYYQSLFVIPQRVAASELLKMERDKTGALTGFLKFTNKPEFGFDSRLIREELESRVTYHDAKLTNLLIKRFPTRSLTIPMLEAYLDNLEGTEKFIPDMILLDSINLMKTDSKNHRISMGHNTEEFRGMLDVRNAAGVTAHQSNRIGAAAGTIKMTHIAEDWTMTNTADQLITMTKTDSEKHFGLARMHVGKARGSSESNFNILITQNYRSGQFCLDSVPLNQKKYDELLTELGKDQKLDLNDDTPNDG